jgi:WD40 repeat protein
MLLLLCLPLVKTYTSLASKKLPFKIAAHSNTAVSVISISTDDNILVSTSGDKFLKLWDLNTLDTTTNNTQAIASYSINNSFNAAHLSNSFLAYQGTDLRLVVLNIKNNNTLLNVSVGFTFRNIFLTN